MVFKLSVAVAPGSFLFKPSVDFVLGNAMEIASGKEVKDPYESLLRVLDSPRYQPVEEALSGLLT